MKFLKEESRKYAGIGICIIVLLLAVAISVTTYFAYRNYCIKVNGVIGGILEAVKQQYSNVSEEELIRILNGTDIGRYKELSDYGIREDTVNVIADMKNVMYRNILISVLVTVAFGLMILVIYLYYLHIENEKINELTRYINEINNKNYDLCLRDNEEGGLSRFKNELYKITVMLKEQTDQSLKEKESLKDSVSDISHQLKTPLTSMNIMLDSLREDEDMDESTRKVFIAHISHQVEWINFLVISLLKLSRFDAGVVEFKKEEINLYKLLTRVVEHLAIPIEIKNIQVTIDGNKDLSFTGDSNWEAEALTNILKNAIEHTDMDKTIHISFEHNHFYMKLTIRDEGQGMDKEDVKHIFERFFKGKNSGEMSIGIGLALSKKIIEKDNGYITVQSVEGKGSTFEIKYMKY